MKVVRNVGSTEDKNQQNLEKKTSRNRCGSEPARQWVGSGMEKLFHTQGIKYKYSIYIMHPGAFCIANTQTLRLQLHS
jgi:hypothetical protein